MPRRGHVFLFLAILLLAACGSQPMASEPAGNAQNGKVLFTQSSMGSSGAPGCASCHSLERDKTLVGPSLATIATNASKTIKAAEYRGSAATVAAFLRESIVSPDAYVTKGFSAGVMPNVYSKLSTAEIDDLVAYLATLK